MAGVREEKRETEGRRDEERRTIARETKMFVEGVEEGRRKQGMKKKRELQGERRRRKDQDQDGKGDGTGAGSSKDTRGDAEIKRTWRQIEVKGQGGRSTETRPDGGISDEVKQVLGKIF